MEKMCGLQKTKNLLMIYYPNKTVRISKNNDDYYVFQRTYDNAGSVSIKTSIIKGEDKFNTELVRFSTTAGKVLSFVGDGVMTDMLCKHTDSNLVNHFIYDFSNDSYDVNGMLVLQSDDFLYCVSGNKRENLINYDVYSFSIVGPSIVQPSNCVGVCQTKGEYTLMTKDNGRITQQHLGKLLPYSDKKASERMQQAGVNGTFLWKGFPWISNNLLVKKNN